MHTLPRQRCITLLQKSSSLATKHITQIHSQLITNNILTSQSPSTLSKLIQHYLKSKSSQHYTHYPHLITTQFYNQTNEQNPYLLNVLIRCMKPIDSIRVFANWVSKNIVRFDDFTYVFVLGACARGGGTLWDGMQVHCRVIKHGFLSNVMLGTTLVHFYVKCGGFVFGRKVFDEMSERSVATWNSLISGYCARKEYARDGLFLFLEMLGGDCGVKVSDTTLVCVLSAVARVGCLETGVVVHGYIVKTVCDVESDVYLGTGLVDMYAKCGCLDSALDVFMSMGCKNVMTWTAMVSGFAVHGKGKQALKFFSDMIESGIVPNSVTFTSLLFACSQAGLLEEGLYLFHDMKTKFRIVPLSHHYGCIVDLLGRVGHLSEAYEFIISEKVEGDEVLWRSLLHACRVHNNIVMGERVAKILISIKPETNLEVYDNTEDYVALSNIHASAGRWEDVAAVREEMNDKGMENKAAVSSVFS
ncbi:editing factor (mitochondrion) [Artemisia annua]|uniref:Editing factor n=1 Tax=Artemisia annua TaxID=35608 RepID=A0A2U1QA27_ARTAN|nr:editing factor [Artemisia annua]